jgi:hypothetical protein
MIQLYFIAFTCLVLFNISSSFILRSCGPSNPFSSQTFTFCNLPIQYNDFTTCIGEIDELNVDPDVDPWRAELNYLIDRQKFKERLVERDAKLREITRYRRLSGGDGKGVDFKSAQPVKERGVVPSIPDK